MELWFQIFEVIYKTSHFSLYSFTRNGWDTKRLRHRENDWLEDVLWQAKTWHGFGSPVWRQHIPLRVSLFEKLKSLNPQNNTLKETHLCTNSPCRILSCLYKYRIPGLDSRHNKHNVVTKKFGVHVRTNLDNSPKLTPLLIYQISVKQLYDA